MNNHTLVNSSTRGVHIMCILRHTIVLQPMVDTLVMADTSVGM